MYEDKTLICKECGKEFVFTAGEQEFYASKGLRTSRRDAKPAARTAKTPQSRSVKCTQRYAPPVARKLRFLSSRAKTALFIAVSALHI